MGLRFRVLREGLQSFLGQGLGISAWALGPRGWGFRVQGVSGFGFVSGWPSGLNPFTEVQYRERGTQRTAESRGVLDFSEHVLAWGLDRFLWLD